MRLPVPWWNVRVTWLFVVIAVIVIAGAFVASLGLLGELPSADLDLRPDRIDGEALLRTLLAYRRGEPRVCAMVRVDLLRKSGEFPMSYEELDDTAATVYEGI